MLRYDRQTSPGLVALYDIRQGIGSILKTLEPTRGHNAYTEMMQCVCLLGIPVRTTLDNSMTVQYAGLLHSLTAQARNCVRDIDPQNDLTFLRVRSKKNEIMVAPGIYARYMVGLCPF